MAHVKCVIVVTCHFIILIIIDVQIHKGAEFHPPIPRTTRASLSYI